jgi:serine/threonine-protein kinase
VAAGVDSAAQGTPSVPGADTPTLRELVANLTVGTVIDGKYAIDSIIGRGGMGVVVSARHVDLGRDVALKFLCSGEGGGGAGNSGDLRARFRREAQISARLDNEHITRVLDVGAWKNASYIVMERLEGVDLRRKLKQSGGSLPLQLALNYTLQICEGIAEAHAHGIVHRDLKPANLFVTRKSDGTDLIKIMDFGISKWNGGEIGEITKDGTLLGSPKYMAPEQVFGTRAIDARADIWSIGAMLFEMVAGRTPYAETTLARLCAALVAGPPPRLDELKPEIPARLATVVARALEGSPSARTSTVAELAGALLDAVDAPGDALRQRLATILALRPAGDAAANSTGGLMSNLGLGPVSGQTVSAQTMPEPPRLVESLRPPDLASGPPPAKTLVSPTSSKSPPAAAPAEARRPPVLYVAVVVAIAAAVAVFVIARTMGSTPNGPRADGTAAPTVIQAPTAVQPTATSTVVMGDAPKPPVVATAEAARSTAATVDPTASAATTAGGAPIHGGKLGPLHGTATHPTVQPAAPPPTKEKKGDDDIPAMR